MNRRTEVALAVLFLTAMALGGYAAGAHPVAVKVKPPSAADVELTNTFCEFYYTWREEQYDRKGLPWADQHCFDAQEMKP